MTFLTSLTIVVAVSFLAMWVDDLLPEDSLADELGRESPPPRLSVFRRLEEPAGIGAPQYEDISS